MALQKAQARSLIRTLVKDQNKDSWSDSALDVLTQTTIDEMYGEILDQQPYLNSQLDVVSAPLIAPGLVDTRVQGVGTGQLTQRMYRLQKVTLANQEYTQAHAEDIAMSPTTTTEIVAPRFSYQFFGYNLYLFPLSVSINAEMRYSFLPAEYNTVPETTNVTWPDGFENVFIFETSARAMLGFDAALAGSYHALAESVRSKMNYALARTSPGPMVPHLIDTPISWGAI